MLVAPILPGFRLIKPWTAAHGAAAFAWLGLRQKKNNQIDLSLESLMGIRPGLAYGIIRDSLE